MIATWSSKDSAYRIRAKAASASQLKLALLLLCAAIAVDDEDADDGEIAVRRESAPFDGALPLDGDEGPEPCDEDRALPPM